MVQVQRTKTRYYTTWWCMLQCTKTWYNTWNYLLGHEYYTLMVYYKLPHAHAVLQHYMHDTTHKHMAQHKHANSPEFSGLSRKLGYCPGVQNSLKSNTVVLVLYVARICIWQRFFPCTMFGNRTCMTAQMRMFVSGDWSCDFCECPAVRNKVFGRSTVGNLLVKS